jgi:tRNA (guanine10-N2)-methyltransferase
MDYLVRFSQTYETFRVPELQALATLEGIEMKVVSYKEDVPPPLHLTF